MRKIKFLPISFIFIFILVSPVFASGSKEFIPRNILANSVNITNDLYLEYETGYELIPLDSRDAIKQFPADVDKHNIIIFEEKPAKAQVKIDIFNYGTEDAIIRYNIAVYDGDGKLIEKHELSPCVESLRSFKKNVLLEFFNKPQVYKGETYFLLLITFSIVQGDFEKEQTLINYLVETEKKEKTLWEKFREYFENIFEDVL